MEGGITAKMQLREGNVPPYANWGCLTIGAPEIPKLRRNGRRMETIKKMKSFKMFTVPQILEHRIKDENTWPSREMRNRYMIEDNLNERQYLGQIYVVTRILHTWYVDFKVHTTVDFFLKRGESKNFSKRSVIHGYLNEIIKWIWARVFS